MNWTEKTIGKSNRFAHAGFAMGHLRWSPGCRRGGHNRFKLVEEVDIVPLPVCTPKKQQPRFLPDPFKIPIKFCQNRLCVVHSSLIRSNHSFNRNFGWMNFWILFQIHDKLRMNCVPSRQVAWKMTLPVESPTFRMNPGRNNIPPKRRATGLPPASASPSSRRRRGPWSTSSAMLRRVAWLYKTLDNRIEKKRFFVL